MNANQIFIVILIACCSPLVYFACLSEDIRPTYTLIHEDGETLLEAACDSLGAALTTPSHTFTNVVLGYIVKTQPNVIVDTFFENGIFQYSPYFALALAAGLDTLGVCDGTVIMDSLMSISGSVSLGDTTIANGSWWIAIDEADHTNWALVSLTEYN